MSFIAQIIYRVFSLFSFIVIFCLLSSWLAAVALRLHEEIVLSFGPKVRFWVQIFSPCCSSSLVAHRLGLFGEGVASVVVAVGGAKGRCCFALETSLFL